MKVLLDTHALLWWLNGDTRLGLKARSMILDTAHQTILKRYLVLGDRAEYQVR